MRLGSIGIELFYAAQLRDTDGTVTALSFTSDGPFGTLTSATFVIVAPNGIRTEQTPAVYGAAADGVLRWQSTDAEDFPVAGSYRLQAVLTFGSLVYPWAVTQFVVEESL